MSCSWNQRCSCTHLPYAQRQPASLNGDGQAWPHQATLDMSRHVILQAKGCLRPSGSPCTGDTHQPASSKRRSNLSQLRRPASSSCAEQLLFQVSVRVQWLKTAAQCSGRLPSPRQGDGRTSPLARFCQERPADTHKALELRFQCLKGGAAISALAAQRLPTRQEVLVHWQ